MVTAVRARRGSFPMCTSRVRHTAVSCEAAPAVHERLATALTEPTTGRQPSLVEIGDWKSEIAICSTQESVMVVHFSPKNGGCP